MKKMSLETQLHKLCFYLPRQIRNNIKRLKLQQCSITNAPPLTLTTKAFISLIEFHSSHPIQLKQIHTLILTSGLSVKNSLLTRLLTSFTLLGDMVYARKLFDKMHKPTEFLWNILIKGYVKNGVQYEAFLIYTKMRDLGVRPDSFTYPFVIKACAELDDVWAGLVVHAHVVKHGLEFVAMVRTEMVIMYVKFSELGCAEYLFNSMIERDLVALNAFISVCTQCGYADKALALFFQMSSGGFMADSVTIVSILSACGQLGCLETGEMIYNFAVEEGIESNIIMDNARLDMYAKCGNIDAATTLFDEMPSRNVVSWSTMIGGYAINGESDKALNLFLLMRNEGVKPNSVTFLGVLSACCHAGLVNEGRDFFNYMVRSKDKSIQPKREHYCCMVDLLGRTGHLNAAYLFIKNMPIEPDTAILGALLGACAIHRNVELGQLVADSLFQLAPDVASYHVILSNMYSMAGRWDKVEKVRQRMTRKGVKKVGAYSSIELNGKVHVLYAGDETHPDSLSIYNKLNELIKLMKNIGYFPKIDCVYHDVELEEKEATLATHSEKLAIALGLIKLSSGSPIRVMKNLRIRDDSHTFSKLASRITRREIIIRDKSRFHHFKNGVCSCMDFW